MGRGMGTSMAGDMGVGMAIDRRMAKSGPLPSTMMSTTR